MHHMTVGSQPLLWPRTRGQEGPAASMTRPSDDQAFRGQAPGLPTSRLPPQGRGNRGLPGLTQPRPPARTTGTDAKRPEGLLAAEGESLHARPPGAELRGQWRGQLPDSPAEEEQAWPTGARTEGMQHRQITRQEREGECNCKE